jgi:hypothetical protein
MGTNKSAAGVSFPCSGFTEVVGAAGGNASARGPQENPINDDADLEESKAVNKDQRRKLFEIFPVTRPGLGRAIDNPGLGETDEDGWKKTENGYPCESDSSYCTGGSLPVVAPVFVATLGSVYVN